MKACLAVYLRYRRIYLYMTAVVMAALFRTGLRRAFGRPAAHHRAHVWSAQGGRSPVCLWLWWLLAVSGDVHLRTG